MRRRGESTLPAGEGAGKGEDRRTPAHEATLPGPAASQLGAVMSGPTVTQPWTLSRRVGRNSPQRRAFSLSYAQPQHLTKVPHALAIEPEAEIGGGGGEATDWSAKRQTPLHF